MPSHKKNSSWNQFVSFVLSCSLIFSQTPAYAERNIPAFSPSDISLPQELGEIEESFQGSSGKTILYIQDAHDSLEAQENIAKTITHLVETYGIKTVYEEGYEGPVPTDEYFGFIKDPVVKEKVSYFLMDKLRIGGAEYAHINRFHPHPNPLRGGEGRVRGDWRLIGVDNIKLHLESIERYRQAAALSRETRQDLGSGQSEISKLANQRFSKELKEWMKLKERLVASQLDLRGYLKRIQDLSAKHIPTQEFQTRYPNVDLILSPHPRHSERSPSTQNAQPFDFAQGGEPVEPRRISKERSFDCASG